MTDRHHDPERNLEAELEQILDPQQRTAFIREAWLYMVAKALEETPNE